MNIEWLQNLLRREISTDATSHDHGTGKSIYENLKEEMDETTSERLSSLQELSSVTHQQSDSKKVISPYYVDTLAPAGTILHEGSFAKVEALKASSEGTSPSHYYKDTIAKADQTVVDFFDAAKVKGMEVKQADEDAQDIQKFQTVMNEFIQEVEEGEKVGDLDFQKLLAQIFRMQIEAKEEESYLARERFMANKSEKLEMNKERITKLEEILKRAQETKVWSRLESAATTLALAATAVGVSSSFGAVALVFAVGNALDKVFDDPAKKAIASLISSNQESKQWWVTVMDLGVSAVSLAATFSNMAIKAGAGLIDASKWISAATSKWIQAATSGIKATTSGAKGWKDYLQNKDQASMIKLTDEISQRDTKIKSAIDEIQRLISSQLNLTRDLMHNLKKSSETASAIFRQ